MEYAIGIYDFDPNNSEVMKRIHEAINIQAKSRWAIKWIGTSYRETKLIILFERMRIQ